MFGTLGPIRTASNVFLLAFRSILSPNVAYHVGPPLFLRAKENLHFISKPKNARSKRALDARQPKEIEDPRTTLFVKGTHTGDILNGVMKELVTISIVIPFFRLIKCADLSQAASHYLV